MRLRAVYDDACFTVAAQDAFLSGFAAEVAHALNIKVELVIDLNAFHTDKHNEMEVRLYDKEGERKIRGGGGTAAALVSYVRFCRGEKMYVMTTCARQNSSTV